MGRPGAPTVIAAVVLLGCGGGDEARAPKSLRDLPPDQHAIEGLAGVKVVSTPLTVKCGDDPAMPVGVRFTRLARRVRSVAVRALAPDRRVLSRGPTFRNSGRWQFGLLRLPGCRRLHEVQYVFHRRGSRRGQILGNHVCVLGRDGEECEVEGEA